jgi:DNA repair protein RecO (recombination protein O)
VPLTSDTCICLRKFEYSETSQVLTLLTRVHGIVRVMAKGAHRRTKAGAARFDGGIDLLDVGQAVLIHDSARELDQLTEWKLTEGHLNLRRSLRGLYLALYAVELVCALFEAHDPHPELFDRLANLLTELSGPRAEEVFLAFELELLVLAGYAPQIDRCAGCGGAVSGTATAWFSPARGGVVCRDCESAHPDRLSLDGRLLRLLAALATPVGNLPRLSRHQTDPLNRLLAEHVMHVLGRPLRLAGYVLPARRADHGNRILRHRPEPPSPGTPGEGRVRVLSSLSKKKSPHPQPSPGVPGEG